LIPVDFACCQPRNFENPSVNIPDAASPAGAVVDLPVALGPMGSLPIPDLPVEGFVVSLWPGLIFSTLKGAPSADFC